MHNYEFFITELSVVSFKQWAMFINMENCKKCTIDMISITRGLWSYEEAGYNI